MADEVFSTTLAYTKSPKVTKRTTFQDELIRAIIARSARQRSSEYSDDFESDVVSSGDFSDTSVDENSVKKNINDFHISDDEEKNSLRPSFLKTKKWNSDIKREEAEVAIKSSEEKSPDVCGESLAGSFSESQNKDQEIEKERIKIKPKPRILPIKSASSAENSSSLEADEHFKPSPRPRSLLKKSGHVEEKEKQGEEVTALSDGLDSSLSSLPELGFRQPEAEKATFSAHVGCEAPSSSPLKESLGRCFPPGSEEQASREDQNGEVKENHNSWKLNEDEENTSLIDNVAPELEKRKGSEVATNDLEKDKEKAGPGVEEEGFTAAPLPLRSLRSVGPPSGTAPAQKTIEDKNTKNKKSTTNRASSASARLMTSEFAKKSSSVRRTPGPAASSHYLGPLKVLDQKPSQRQSLEPDGADHIRAAVYQKWLEKKNVHLHEKNRIKRIESENLRIQNEQQRAAKREEALASFEAWKAVKQKEARKRAAQKRLEEEHRRRAEEESAQRRGEALQAFEKWKEKKMEYLKEKNKKEKEYERAKKRKEEETVAEKKKENLTAVEKWNERKEAFFKQKEKEKINEKRKEELRRAEKNDKDKQAINEYGKWLEKKEKQEKIERKQKKQHSFLDSAALPPWSPSSRSVFSRVF
ncbi:microtubule-associated protein 9 [Octodon degus]|uniref:Microtubule-associated protein 9 n=1 Tax=Octodon degus TaxID=10160 RepID=A0A6P6F4H4_OCTDE|nr:microtubule-associated protein 9 [Octodon degus]